MRAREAWRAYGSPKLFGLSRQVLVGLCDARHDPLTFRMTDFISHGPGFFGPTQQILFVPGQPGQRFGLAQEFLTRSTTRLANLHSAFPTIGKVVRSQYIESLL